MKNAILLHGMPSEKEYYDPTQPSASNAHWFPWLQNQLLVHDIKADTPEIPRPFDMDWDIWLKEVDRFDINPDTILVGHSMGAGFWIRYLNERPEIKFDQLVLVAPWLNLDGSYDTNIFDFVINPKLIDQVEKFTIFSSDNDDLDVQNTVEFLESKFPKAKLTNFHNYGHFCYKDMGTDAFPELLAEIIS